MQDSKSNVNEVDEQGGGKLRLHCCCDVNQIVVVVQLLNEKEEEEKSDC